MFKNITIFRLNNALDLSLEDCSESISRERFVPCGAAEEKSSGWLEPRGHAHGAMVESVAGQWIFKFKTESKAVPSSVVKRKLDEQVRKIEQDSGRKPGKKEKRDLQDSIRQSLLPQAFTKEATVWIWLDPESRLVVLGTVNQSKVDEILTSLSNVLPGFTSMALETSTAPATAMAAWLQAQESPNYFSIDNECELKATDESKAVVRYSRHSLMNEEVAQHIEQGKRPTRLALTWRDRVSLMLTDTLQLKKITLTDVVFENQPDSGGGDDNFDTDIALLTGELQELIPDLMEVLDGELRRDALPSV